MFSESETMKIDRILNQIHHLKVLRCKKAKLDFFWILTVPIVLQTRSQNVYKNGNICLLLFITELHMKSDLPSSNYLTDDF